MHSTRATPGSIYIFMAVVLIATAIASFAPTSLRLVSGVWSGERPPPPFIVHFHAVSMTSWLLLLLAQSTLALKNRLHVHRKLGMLSFVLAPCILVSMYGMDLYGLETFRTETNVLAMSETPPEQVAQMRRYIASILLIHGSSYLLFPTFFIWAILVRRTDNETHRRLMVLATLVLMIPGVGRLLSVTSVLPDFGLSLLDARHFYLLLLIAPALVYDVVQHRALHRSYVIGMTLLVGWMVIGRILWTSPWWLETAPLLLGVA